MPFYLRKSFSIGKFLKINISKSGFGYSFGVTGARFGQKPDGSTYIHSGKNGFYYRATLSNKNDESNLNNWSLLQSIPEIVSCIVHAPIVIWKYIYYILNNFKYNSKQIYSIITKLIVCVVGVCILIPLVMVISSYFAPEIFPNSPETNSNGQEVYIGPNGGRYIINSQGNKDYNKTSTRFEYNHINNNKEIDISKCIQKSEPQTLDEIIKSKENLKIISDMYANDKETKKKKEDELRISQDFIDAQSISYRSYWKKLYDNN